MQNEDQTQTLLPQKKSQTSQKKRNIVHSKWRKIDDTYLKPFFIYNYSEVKAEIDYLHKLSVHEIYKVEFNADAMDYRNPLPYSIKEIDVSQIIQREREKRNYKTVGHLTDNDVSIEGEIEKGIALRKSDGKLVYQGYNNDVVFSQEESFGSPGRNQSNEELLRRQYFRERMRSELASKNCSSKKLKKLRKSTGSKKKDKDSSVNKGDLEDSSDEEFPEERKERNHRG